MDLAAKKLAFIEEYLHLSNEILIDKLDSLLHKEKEKSTSQKSLSDFWGILSKEEGSNLTKSISQGCRRIDYNEW
jgi:hypothetical protein